MGKSTTTKIFSNSILELQNNQTLELIKLQISNNSNYFFKKATPILIDEWQEIPETWDLITLEIDKRNKNGQFILTGSKTPDTTKIHHSGIGRINKIKMSTLSLFESNESSNQISLSKILNNEQDNYFFESEKDLKLVEAIIKVYARNVPSMIFNNTIKKILNQY